MNHAPKEIKDTIFQNLLRRLEPTEITRNYESKMRSKDIPGVMILQNTIGWRNIIRGPITIEWGRIIIRNRHNHQITKITAEQWGFKILE